MPVIHLVTEIDAPIERCFDLARSIDFHLAAASHTGEQAVGGVTSGLIGLDETVTWRAKHLGVWQFLTSKITAMNRPHSFQDEMLKGAFKRMCHEHTFEQRNGKTILTDKFRYESPLNMLGKIADVLFLEQYMTRFLRNRNQRLKAALESDEWKHFL